MKKKRVWPDQLQFLKWGMDCIFFGIPIGLVVAIIVNAWWPLAIVGGVLIFCVGLGPMISGALEGGSGSANREADDRLLDAQDGSDF